MKSASYYTNEETSCFYTWGVHFGLVQTANNNTNKQDLMVSFLWRVKSRSYLIAPVCFSDHWQRYVEKKVISLHRATIDAVHRKARAQNWGSLLNQILHSAEAILFHWLECQKAHTENEGMSSDFKPGTFHSAKIYSRDE